MHAYSGSDPTHGYILALSLGLTSIFKYWCSSLIHSLVTFFVIYNIVVCIVEIAAIILTRNGFYLSLAPCLMTLIYTFSLQLCYQQWKFNIIQCIAFAYKFMTIWLLFAEIINLCSLPVCHNSIWMGTCSLFHFNLFKSAKTKELSWKLFKHEVVYHKPIKAQF